MPDFERLTRRLELFVAKTPEQLAFILRKHAGVDAARWQVVLTVAVIALITLLIAAAMQ